MYFLYRASPIQYTCTCMCVLCLSNQLVGAPVVPLIYTMYTCTCIVSLVFAWCTYKGTQLQDHGHDSSLDEVWYCWDQLQLCREQSVCHAEISPATDFQYLLLRTRLLLCWRWRNILVEEICTCTCSLLCVYTHLLLIAIVTV